MRNFILTKMGDYLHILQVVRVSYGVGLILLLELLSFGSCSTIHHVNGRVVRHGHSRYRDTTARLSKYRYVTKTMNTGLLYSQ